MPLKNGIVAKMQGTLLFPKSSEDKALTQRVTRCRQSPAAVKSGEGWEHDICSLHVRMISAEDRRRGDGRRDCEMLLVGRMRVPEWMLT